MTGSIEEAQKRRFALLHDIYDLSEGGLGYWFALDGLAEHLGWDLETTYKTAQYLRAEGLLSFVSENAVAITPEGIKHIEAPVGEPSGDAQPARSTVHIYGGVHGSVVNVDSVLANASQSISLLSEVETSTRDELEKLLKQLEEALAQVPEEHAQDAEAVAYATQSLVETVAEEQPGRAKIQVTRDGLIRAAKNLKAVVPTVLAIAAQVAAAIQRIADSKPPG